jgi:ParB-like nuclease domain
VSEFERVRSVVPPYTPPARPAAFLPDDDGEPDDLAEPSYQREGLPPGFRMRHDAHYVDQLTMRSAAPQVRLIPLRDIDAPRAADAGDLDALSRSIGTHGVLQPLLVRPRAGRFDLIAGGRRLAAAAAAGLTEVPCLVHQVDDTRARGLADAENLHAAAIVPSPERQASDVSGPALSELSQSFSAIGSCLHLLAERDVTLRDRVALDLVRTEVYRATRLVRCLAALSRDASLSEADVSLPTTVDQVVEAFAPERRLSGASIAVDTSEGPFHLRADQDWLAVGLAGAIGGMLALVHGAKSPGVIVRISSSGSRASLMIEIAQQAVTVPAWALGRFFDLTWTDRAGGYPAAAELAAARRIAEWHRGGAEVLPGERGGCRLVLLFPTA